MLRTALIALLAVTLAGCATIDADCPTDGSTIEAAVGGSTVGTTGLQLATAAATGAGAMAGPNTPPAPSPGACHVHYTYLPIFGSDYVRVGKLPSSTVVVTSPPASIVH